MLRDDGTFYLDDRLLSEMTPEEKREVCRKLGIEYKE